jgi:hypothetical protein
MSKSRQTRDTARAMVSPMFAWSNAVLKGGEMMLDSMHAAAKAAKSVTVAVLPDVDAPKRTRKRKSGARRARARKASRR